MKMMKRIGLYARVSSADQNIETQLLPLREHCQRVPCEITEYIDDGFSGKDDKRPAFERLLADVRANKIDCVLVYKLDRMAEKREKMVTKIREEEKESKR